MSGVMTPRSGVITPLLTSLPDITVGDVKEKEMSGVMTPLRGVITPRSGVMG